MDGGGKVEERREEVCRGKELGFSLSLCYPKGFFAWRSASGRVEEGLKACMGRGGYARLIGSIERPVILDRVSDDGHGGGWDGPSVAQRSFYIRLTLCEGVLSNPVRMVMTRAAMLDDSLRVLVTSSLCF